MSEKQEGLPALNAIFTRDSFYVEAQGPDDPWTKKWTADFAQDRFRSLFELGFLEKPQMASPTFHWLYLFSSAFARALSKTPGLELSREKTKVSFQEDAKTLLYSLPFGLGTEFVDEDWICRSADRLNDVFCESIRSYDGTVAMFLTEKSQQLRIPERIFFHLVEDREGGGPFAFLATYATRTADGAVKHMPLSYALVEYKGQREKLLTLLSCLNRASDVCGLIGQFVVSGELFHPLRLSAGEAYEILKCVPQIEETGILCRVPNWWKRQDSSVRMQVTLGEKKPSLLGFQSLVSMRPSLVVDGMPLTEEDIRMLLTQAEGLAFLKGKWVEVNHQKLEELLSRMEDCKGELSLLDAMRAEAGMENRKIPVDVGTLISNGEWLGELLHKLRQPTAIAPEAVPQEVKASLRPYQETGFNWLHYMGELGFGACLADDMGLGKTLQVLSYLRFLYQKDEETDVLLIVPASLLGNWEKELLKFVPDLPYVILHGIPMRRIDQMVREEPVFLTITTYGMAAKIQSLQEFSWDYLILDEAQAIKNPATKQTRTIKKITADHRIAMTGTPIENELTNLWSLFDFLNKGLLGSSGEFDEFAKNLEKHEEGYQRLKNMVSPFILRRLKTDKSIIADLPDKMEQVDYVSLSKKQVALYRKQVAELESTLGTLSGIQRRGIVLAAITKLKQICNHPDQFLGQEGFVPEESGKFAMLREICSTIYEKRERVLIFTQYREIIDYLERYLETIFGSKGLVLHGGTRVARRAELVDQFNGESYVPFMILSVRAGGTGLNLTAANHVIHFDRWWNPAVENQATDRAYRIGQQKNVMVHKLVSKGTIEEKIDALISSKKELAENVIGGSGENWITEMGNQELLNLMRLDA